MKKVGCNSHIMRYVVSDIGRASGGIDSLFFNVVQVCKDCDSSQVVALHTLKIGMDVTLFKEHHLRTIEYYTGIRS